MVLLVAKIILNSFWLYETKPLPSRISPSCAAPVTPQDTSVSCRRLSAKGISRLTQPGGELRNWPHDVPARFIPVIAYVLKADITDLFPPIGGQAESTLAPTLARIRNLTGQQIRALRRNRKWSQSKLAGVIRTMGAPMTREIIANLETRRTRVKDYDLVLIAKALQIPMDSLFPDEARTTNFPDAFNNNPQSQNPLETRRRNGQLNPFTRMARKIGRFAKRLITRKKNLKLFFALKTLNENGVQVDN